jgi:signal transduction histidine kinase/tetratricopeptide (TPR) repeat protein
MPKGKKILLLFLFGIVLPCMLLGYLAFRGVQNDRALLEKNRLEEHRRIAGQVIQKVDENLLSAERAFQTFFWEKDQNDFSGMIRQLEGLKTSHPLIEEVFAIISDRSIRFVGAFFLYHPQVGTNLFADTRPDPSVERLIMQGERSEFQKKDHDGALGAYRKALEMASDPQIQGDLLSKMARVQKKSRQFQEAIKTYEMILDKYGQILIMKGIPLGLIARMEIGALYGEMKNPAKALDTFLGLFRDLITGEWVLDKESYNFYSTRIRDSIPGILSQVSSSEKQPAQKDAFLALIDEENLKIEETEKLLSFLREAPSERDLLAYRSGENTLNRKKRFVWEIGTHTYFVCLPENEPVEDETRGFLVDEDYLAEDLLSGIMQTIVSDEGIDWTIHGRDGKTILASTGTPSGSQTIDSGFIENFPDWTIQFYQADPHLLEAFLTSRRGVYFYMFILIAGILIFGLILTMRSFTREMELARMKSDFVSTVSHEFKSPLTSIRQIAEMLHAGRVPSEDRRQNYYDVLLEQSERLSLLTENVLSFAKMEEGKREFLFEQTDVKALLSNIVSTIQDRVQHDGFAIETQIDASLVPVKADASALTQAINNLIDNAVKYSGASKRVVIRALNDEKSVVIEVEDFGLGIKKEEVNKIFDRFYRGGDELTRTVKGSGLGLTLVKQIVEAHKGTIQVESETGKGTIFTLRLPLYPNKG